MNACACVYFCNLRQSARFFRICLNFVRRYPDKLRKSLRNAEEPSVICKKEVITYFNDTSSEEEIIVLVGDNFEKLF